MKEEAESLNQLCLQRLQRYNELQNFVAFHEFRESGIYGLKKKTSKTTLQDKKATEKILYLKGVKKIQVFRSVFLFAFEQRKSTKCCFA